MEIEHSTYIDGERGVCTEEIDDGVDAEFDSVEKMLYLKETFDNTKRWIRGLFVSIDLGSKGYECRFVSWGGMKKFWLCL